MIAIDTNILVRYLTGDDETQSEKAANLIEKFAGNPNSIYINNIVLCELIWVLDRGYKYSKKDLVTLLKNIVSTIEFSFSDNKILWLSIMQYEKEEADFADILIGEFNKAAGFYPTYTFDKKASMLQTFKEIELC